MKIKLFYLEADGLESADIKTFIHSFQTLMTAPVAGDEQLVMDEASPATAIDENIESAPAQTVATTKEMPDAVGDDDSPDTSDRPLALDWPTPLSEVAGLLDTGRTSWRKVDREIRQALAEQMIRTLIQENYCPMPEFDRQRPPWMPKAISLAQSFGLKWSELVNLAQQAEGEVAESTVHEPAAPVALNGHARGHL